MKLLTNRKYKQYYLFQRISGKGYWISILAAVFMLLACESITFCGIAPTANLVESLQELIRTMNEEEAEVFQREIRLQPERGWSQEPENPAPVNRWNSVAIFLAGTFLVFIISQYGREILNAIFDLGRASVQSMHVLGELAVNHPRLLQEVTELLATPEGQQRVLNGVRAVHQLRTGG